MLNAAHFVQTILLWFKSDQMIVNTEMFTIFVKTRQRENNDKVENMKLNNLWIMNSLICLTTEPYLSILILNDPEGMSKFSWEYWVSVWVFTSLKVLCNESLYKAKNKNEMMTNSWMSNLNMKFKIDFHQQCCKEKEIL